jgi:hypothetical protein
MVVQKNCRDCGELKPLNEFYTHKQMFDGHLNKCKECVKKRVHEHRGNNLEKIKEYDRNRPNKKERVEKFRQYIDYIRENDVEKYNSHLKHRKDYLQWLKLNDVEKYNHYVQTHNKACKIWRQSKNHVHNHVARKLVNPKICEKCGSDYYVQGHHEDYSKPLDVIWLCCKCHMKRHREIRNEKRLKEIQ